MSSSRAPKSDTNLKENSDETKKSRWSVWVGGLTLSFLLSGLFALPGFLDSSFSVFDRFTENQESVSSSEQIPAPSSSSIPAADASRAPDESQGGNVEVSVGACVKDSTALLSPVDCSTPHQAEIIGTSDAQCTEDSLTEYAGGKVGIDIIGPGFGVQEAEGHCLLVSETVRLETPLQGILGRPEGHAIRECFDSQTATTVLCSTPHTGEVVGRTPVDAVSPTSCEEKASTYLGRPISTRFEDLTLDEGSDSAYRRCIVSVRAQNAYLETPLRALGNGQIETSSF